MKSNRGLAFALIFGVLGAGAGFWMLGARHERRWRAERGLPVNF